MKLLKISLILFLVFMISGIVYSSEANLQATVIILGKFITINSPVNYQFYETTQINLDIFLREKAKFLYYTLNNNTEIRLCNNCDFYSGTILAETGENDLIIKAEDFNKNIYHEPVYFYVDAIPDSTPPVIHVTYPSKTGNGNFGVQYTEENLKEVILYYGQNLENTYIFQNCSSGT